jgi:hypothetical protein
MLTKKQLAEEQKREKLINHLSEKVISKTAWGKFYGLMRLASSTGEKNIPHKVCLDKDGRVQKIYKSKAGKWIGAFLKPAHEQMARDVSRHKYGRAVLDMVGFGSFLDARDQMHAKCLVLKPKDVVRLKDQNKKGLEKFAKAVKKNNTIQ